MITDQRFAEAAKKLRCKISDIRAVDEVESGGAGMDGNKPIILFEPHIFWKYLRKAGVDPSKYLETHGDMLYPTWGEKPYPKGQAAQWARLDRAVKIHREAALMSCSWGRYQICGFNYQAAGCSSVQDFVNQMYKGEDQQLDLYVNYIIDACLDDELRANDWRGYAAGYNGKYYWKNNYDKKLAAAKLKWAKIYG